MARKRLMKGANALRVEERIARVPLDMVRPEEGETGIFEALKAAEREAAAADEASGASKGPRASKGSRASKGPRPARARAASGKAVPGKAAPVAAASARPASARAKAEARLGPDSFTAAERRAIVVSCTEYRNRLPTYLRSAQGELEIIDSILRKCGSAAGRA